MGTVRELQLGRKGTLEHGPSGNATMVERNYTTSPYPSFPSQSRRFFRLSSQFFIPSLERKNIFQNEALGKLSEIKCKLHCSPYRRLFAVTLYRRVWLLPGLTPVRGLLRARNYKMEGLERHHTTHATTVHLQVTFVITINFNAHPS